MVAWRRDGDHLFVQDSQLIAAARQGERVEIFEQLESRSRRCGDGDGARVHCQRRIERYDHGTRDQQEHINTRGANAQLFIAQIVLPTIEIGEAIEAGRLLRTDSEREDAT